MRARTRARATDHGSRGLRKAEGDPDAADGGRQGEVHLGGKVEKVGYYRQSVEGAAHQNDIWALNKGSTKGR